MKKIALIPLFFMMFFSAMAMTSGFHYMVNHAWEMMQTALILFVFYGLKKFIKERKKLWIIVGVEMVLTLGTFWFFREELIHGFEELFAQWGYRIQYSFGMTIFQSSVQNSGDILYAVLFLSCFVDLLSLYLYETTESPLISALPTFVFFQIPILLDGVPETVCFLGFYMALILFLGSRKLTSLRSFALLTGMVIVTLLITHKVSDWAQVQPAMVEHMDHIASVINVEEIGNKLLGTGTSSGKSERGNKKEERDKIKEDEGRFHLVDFGSYATDGKVKYNGTIELFLDVHKVKKKEDVYLGHYVSTLYRNNVWTNRENREEEYFVSNYYKLNDRTHREPKGIELLDGYDWAEYYKMYCVPKKMWNRAMKRKFTGQYYDISQLVSKNDDGVMTYETVDSSLDMDTNLGERIRDEIYKGRERNFKTIGDVVNFVKRYLAANYRYTLRPGPLEKDELSSFLFERKTGYCTHFATAAIMMFRSVGIPSRMCQGYKVSKYRIRENELIKVYDSNAHAWVEIYDKKLGWVTLDVTPYTNDIDLEIAKEKRKKLEEWARAEQEDPDLQLPQQVVVDVEEEIPDETTWEMPEEEEMPEETEEPEKTETAAPEESTVPPAKDKTVEKQSESIKNDNTTKVVCVWLGISIFSILLVVGVVYFLRKRCWKKLVKRFEADTNGKILYIHEQFIPMWKELNCTWTYQNSEEMMRQVERVTKDFCTAEEAERLVHILYQCKFGKAPISVDSQRFFKTFMIALRNFLHETGAKKVWKKCKKCSKVILLIDEK